MGSVCTYDKENAQDDKKKGNKHIENDCPFQLTNIKLHILQGDLLVLFIKQQDDESIESNYHFKDYKYKKGVQRIYEAIKKHKQLAKGKKYFIITLKPYQKQQWGIKFNKIGVVLLDKYNYNNESFRAALRVFFDQLKRTETKKQKNRENKDQVITYKVHEIQSIVVAQFPPSLQVPTNVGLKALIDNLRNADKQVTQIRVRCDGQVSLRESRKYVESNRHRKIHY